MKLTKAETEQLEDGLEIHRTVRRHPITEKPLKCSVKRGDVVEAHGKFLAVVGLPRLTDGAQGEQKWLIRFEEVGKWALKARDKRQNESTRKIEEELPAVLSFSEQPNVEPGDVFVFKSELVNGEDLPKVYLRVVSTPIRGKKGDWRVNYMKVGFDTDEYLAKSTGYTENPLVAIDDLPVAPKSWQDAGVGERELRRQMDRKEVLKQEDEILKAAARLRQVGKQSSRKGRDLTFMLKDIYDRLAEEERELRKAA